MDKMELSSRRRHGMGFLDAMHHLHIYELEFLVEVSGHKAVTCCPRHEITCVLGVPLMCYMFLKAMDD